MTKTHTIHVAESRLVGLHFPYEMTYIATAHCSCGWQSREGQGHSFSEARAMIAGDSYHHEEGSA